MDTTEKKTPEEALKEKIIRQILDGTGEIKDFKEVIIHNVFDNRWRIDIWQWYWNPDCDNDYKGHRICQSYFIHVDDAGSITKCNPELGTEQKVIFTNEKLPSREDS